MSVGLNRIGPTKKTPKKIRATQRKGHAKKVAQLILRTAKEFWLPRRELIEDEFIMCLNEAFRKLPPSKQIKERNELAIATRIAKFKRRLGGFYLLWAIYWNQPKTPTKLRNIEITPHDFETMKAFEKELKTIPIDFVCKEDRARLVEQVQFMMNQLVQNRAYDICPFAEDVSNSDFKSLFYGLSSKLMGMNELNCVCFYSTTAAT